MRRNTVLCALVLVAAGGFYASQRPAPVGPAQDATANAVARPEDIHHELQIDIPLASEFGSEQDVKRRLQLEDEVAAELGAHGLVDGGDIGDGVMGIYVVDIDDVPRAAARIKAVLARHDLLATSAILHWEMTADGQALADASVLWPPIYGGVFARWFWPEATNCESAPATTP